MKKWPNFNEHGDLAPGLYSASLKEVLEQFGEENLTRRALGQRLQRVYIAVRETGHLARFIVFGSFVTRKAEPGDIDIFLLMDDSFDVSQVKGESAIIFDHMAAHNYLGASIFWLRRLAVLEGEKAIVEDWQVKRDGSQRGIIEIVEHDKE